MVYYFTSKAVDPAAFIYVGKDKFESAFLRLCVDEAGTASACTFMGDGSERNGERLTK